MSDEKPALEVGQEVWLYAQRSAPTRGTIIKIGRALVTIKPGTWREEKYRLDTRALNGNHVSGYFFRTDAEAAEVERRTVVVAELRERGIEIRMGHTVSLDKLERILAAVNQ